VDLLTKTGKRAKESIVVALKRFQGEDDASADGDARLPLATGGALDLAVAIEQVMGQFPKTLDYLAK
jgi:hypothetical protein